MLVPRHKHSYCSPLHFLPRASSKIIINSVSTLLDESRKSKQKKKHLIQFQLFTFFKPARLQKNLHGRLLSIRVFSSNGHYGLMDTITSF